MTKSKKDRIISLMMAILILVSSMGFSIDVHYCQGQIKSFSLFGKAESCHQEVKKQHCTKHKKSCHAAPSNQEKLSSCKKDCCSNKTIIVESNDEARKLQSLKLSQKQVEFVSVFVQVFFLVKTDLNKNIVPHLNYIPPLLNKDIPVLIQSFLL
jgi:hypothetical protein